MNSLRITGLTYSTSIMKFNKIIHPKNGLINLKIIPYRLLTFKCKDLKFNSSNVNYFHMTHKQNYSKEGPNSTMNFKISKFFSASNRRTSSNSFRTFVMQWRGERRFLRSWSIKIIWRICRSKI